MTCRSLVGSRGAGIAGRCLAPELPEALLELLLPEALLELLLPEVLLEPLLLVELPEPLLLEALPELLLPEALPELLLLEALPEAELSDVIFALSFFYLSISFCVIRSRKRILRFFPVFGRPYREIIFILFAHRGV